MTSPYADLDRPPLSARSLTAGLAGGLWRPVSVVAETGSTNADVAAAARAGAPEGLVLVAESQTAGRGRLDRGWVAPARAGLTVSVLLRPAPVPPTRWAVLPLLAGVAVATALRAAAEVEAVLKWPNDVLVGDRKLAGLLAEVVGDAVVLGLGLNVSTRADELPVPTATSLALEGSASLDRAVLLRAVLRTLERDYGGWRDAGGEPGDLLAAYRPLSATLGRQVVVELPGGRRLTGAATDVDVTGALVVDGRPVAAGDVVHVRPA